MANTDAKGMLPRDSKSYWIESTHFPTFGKLENDMEVDVVIVGGGITGITTAYLLANEGVKVALIEADRILNGTTGHTTAKVTAQHDVIYDEIITNMGRSKARLYYEANMEALHFIQKTIEENQIECDFRNQDAWIYATTEQNAQKLKQEAKAYEKLGIEGALVDSIPFDLSVKNALIMKNQAQFHPLQYLKHLVQQFIDKEGQIFEQTVGVNVEKVDEKRILITREGNRITANFVLTCSHFPFYEGLGFYSAKMYADRSYVLAAKTKKQLPKGMFISADNPTRSLRTVMINGEEMVLIVGESHRAGQGVDTMKHYEALEKFGQEVLGLESILYRWSTQDLTTLDKIPYVGVITADEKNILISTGYRKWGMTNGTAAALLLSDLVLGRKNNYEALYTPARFYMAPSLKNFFVHNAKVVGHLIKGKLEVSSIDPKKLKNDEGAVVTIRGERKGAYRDSEGNLHLVDTTCTHVGCEVEWNGSERTWDCPCHGSRFSYTGEVVEGPAEKPLQKYDYKMLDNLTSEDSGY